MKMKEPAEVLAERIACAQLARTIFSHIVASQDEKPSAHQSILRIKNRAFKAASHIIADAIEKRTAIKLSIDK